MCGLLRATNIRQFWKEFLNRRHVLGHGTRRPYCIFVSQSSSASGTQQVRMMYTSKTTNYFFFSSPKIRLVAYVTDSPKPPPQRVTFTYPLINNSLNTWFVVTGAEKYPVLHDIFKLNKRVVPAALTSSKQNVVHWFVDRAAAGELPETQNSNL